MSQVERVVQSDKVWASLITNMSYLPGLLTLHHSLVSSNTVYPFIALHTDSFPTEGRAALAARGIPLHRMLVRRNMDELMTHPPLNPAAAAAASTAGTKVFAAGHACTCNPLKKPHYPPTWVPASCPFTAHYGALRRDSGARRERACGLFRGRWVGLPYVYNALKTLRWRGVHDVIWRDEEVKNVHYILSPKPWDCCEDDGAEGHDESHRWWWAADGERRAREKADGIADGY
ncbi:glycosyltransferase family 8 protein [Colletotrichum gloeosporioides 23]|nr:glycosyltransferase family 8 protein [Colletotrichum gloeosporioides 23]